MDLAYFNNKQILVTGAGGFIGWSLVKQLAQVQCRILAVSQRRSAKIKGQASLSWLKKDVRQKSFWQPLLTGTNVVFHLAAQTSSQLANANPVMDLEINLLPVARLIETCVGLGNYPDIIFPATVTQVGLTQTSRPVSERQKDKPLTIYDIDKLAAEKYLQFYSRATAGRAVSLRLANVYGPGPQSCKQDRGILNRFIRKAIKGQPLTIYGKGKFVRDYVYVGDVVKALILGAIHIDTTANNYYVIGSGQGYSFAQMAKLVCRSVRRLTKAKPIVQQVKPPDDILAIEGRSFVANYHKFSQTTGWKPQVSLKEGVNLTIKYLLGKPVKKASLSV